MANENEKKQEQGKEPSKNKRGRRRYFRRKKSKPEESTGPSSSGSTGESSAQSADGQKTARGKQKRGSGGQRNRRRRRRSKSRSSSYSGPSIMQEIETDYVAPESVYVYTHVLRPDQRDSYNFRSDIASGTGRTLEDFYLDLSLIFPPDGEPIPQTAANSVARATAQFRESRAAALAEDNGEEDDGEEDDDTLEGDALDGGTGDQSSDMNRSNEA